MEAVKRKDLKVGEEYAVFSVTENPRWRRVSRVRVLHTEPWAKKSEYSRSPYIAEDTKGSGVHVEVLNGVAPPGGGWRREGETVIPLASIRMPWVEWEVVSAEEERSEAEVQAKREADNAAWMQRVEAVRKALAEFGIELADHNTPPLFRDGSHGYTWALSMDTMEQIVDRLRSRG